MNKAYRFDPQTKELLGVIIVSENNDPEHRDDLTYDKPPKAGPKQIPVYKDGVWSLTCDHRATVFHENGTTRFVTEVGVEPDPSWSVLPE